jgi:hypothetical protein
MRTSTVRDLGGFDESLAVTADWDLYLRLVQVGDLASSTDLTVGYTEHGDNMHLAADLALREFPRLDARYASTAGGAKERAFTDACSNWIATSYRTSGRRFSAARWYLRSFRSQGERRDLGRALGMLLGERVIRASGLQRKENPPAGIAPWLERLARIDELPEDVVPWARAAGAAGRFTH